MVGKICQQKHVLAKFETHISTNIGFRVFVKVRAHGLVDSCGTATFLHKGNKDLSLRDVFLKS